MVSSGFFAQISEILIFVIQYWNMILPIFAVIALWSLVRLIRALII